MLPKTIENCISERHDIKQLREVSVIPTYYNLLDDPLILSGASLLDFLNQNLRILPVYSYDQRHVTIYSNKSHAPCLGDRYSPRYFPLYFLNV